MSLKKLLSKTTLDNITIQDITDDAEVSRKTFYYHFQDIYDLLDWTLQEDARHLVANKINLDNWEESIAALFVYMQENRMLVLNAFHSLERDTREKEVFNRSLDNVYRDFTAKVAAARNISPEKMDKLARGRVWTGIQAVENGLADEIGGIDRAVAYAKQLGGIPPKSRFGIAYYPKAKTLQEKIAELVGGGPKISVNKVINQMGLDIESVNMLKRLQYETVLPPFKLDL